MDQRLMPDVLDIREVVFTNMLLLDFRPGVFEAKHHCPFTRDAFIFPNKKAMEEVFYFLFMKLNPTVAKEEFRHCWPIHDKKQESTFRKVSVQWLNRLNKEVHDSNIPRVVASVLMSPGGDKFYHLLFCFSSFVLKEEVRKILPRDEMILPWPSTSSTAKSFPHQTSKLLTAKIILENERFIHNVELSTKAQEKWIQFANELTRQNRAIRKRRREIEKELKTLEVEHLKRGLLSPASNQQSAHHNSPYSGQIKSLQRTKILQRVRGYWKRISEMHESHRILREKIDQIVQGSTNKYALRAADINIRVPDLLLRECEEEIYQKRITNTFESGCVNLLSLVQLLNLSLHLILEQVRSHQLPSVIEEEVDAREKLHTQSAYLQATQSLKEIVEKEMIPELNESIIELQEVVEFSNSLKHTTPKASGKFDFSLAGLPMTPSVHLSTESEYDQEREQVAIPKDLFESSKVLTPDAVEKLVQSLRNSTINDSPQEYMGKKEMTEKPPPGTATKKSAAPTQQLRGRIPVPIARSATKQKLDRSTTLNKNSFSTEKELAMRKKVDKKQQLLLDTKRFDGIQQFSSKEKLSKDNEISQSKGERIAHDILADKIAFSVLSKDEISRSSSSSSSSSSRCQTPMEHALEDPTSAMNKDAFKARDKIQRTPLKKDNQVGERHSFHDALQSYLRQTLLSENGLTPKPTNLIEGLADTPKSGLFDGSFYSHTPKQILLHSGNVDDVNQDSDRHMRHKVNDCEREADAAESPQFDEEFQTPVVNRAIELSVRNSVLEPKGPYDSLGGSNNPLETPTKAVENTKERFYKPISPFHSETKVVSQGPSAPDMVPRIEKLEISPEFSGLGLSGSIPNTPEDRTKDTVKEETQLSSSKDGLAEIIMRYKNLKMKSQKTKVDPHCDPEEKDPIHDKPSETVDDRAFNENYKAKSNENEPKIATSNFSFNIIDDMASVDDQSFIEIARNSATKEVATWATLKKHIASFEDNDEQRLESNYDSFDDLQIPVAKQLSFLQLDTSGMSPSLLRQNSPSRRVGGNCDSMEFGSHTREIYVKPIEPDLGNSEMGRSLIFGAQKEARSLDHLTNRKVKRKNVEPKSELREPGISKIEFHSESDESKPPLTDCPMDTTDQYFRNDKNIQKEVPNDFKTSHPILETPKRKTQDESFNILTPGLELQRGVELFAMDVESSGLDGGSPREESEDSDKDMNLISF